MTDTPSGVADGTLRDGAEASSRSVVESFWSRGKLLAPVLGPRHRGTRVATYFGGGDTALIQFGDFGHRTEVWTTLDSIADLVSDLQSVLVRAQLAREVASGTPGTYAPSYAEIPDEDIPW